MEAFVVDMGLFLVAASVGDIYLTADNGLDPVLFAGSVKIYCSVHYSVIGKRDSRRPMLFGELDHIFDLREAIEKRVMTVCV